MATLPHSVMLVVCLGIPSLLASTSKTESASIKSPNIVFVLADDVGMNDVGYSSSDLPGITKSIDELAKSGIILKNSYSLQVCTPARASLLTGNYPINTGTQYQIIMLKGREPEWKKE